MKLTYLGMVTKENIEGLVVKLMEYLRDKNKWSK